MTNIAELRGMREATEALAWYEHMAKDMQRVCLQQDSQVMLHLMKQLSLDGGKKAREALAALEGK